MNDIRGFIREREAAELAGAAKRRQSWLALQREDEVGSEWRESESTLMQYPGTTGIAGVILCIVGLVFSIAPVVGGLIAIPCVVIGLPLSGAAFYRARESGTRSGVAIAVAGCVTGVVAIVFSSWVGTYMLYTIATLSG